MHVGLGLAGLRTEPLVQGGGTRHDLHLRVGSVTDDGLMCLRYRCTCIVSVSMKRSSSICEVDGVGTGDIHGQGLTIAVGQVPAGRIGAF